MYDDVTVARFWSKVDKRGPDECWEWRGNLSAGYGSFSALGKTMNAHRHAQIVNGTPCLPDLSWTIFAAIVLASIPPTSATSPIR